MSKRVNRNSKSNRSGYDFPEIYRQLRTNIEYAQIEKECKVINITSASPSEGKSTTAYNLAGVFATKYKKTLLIDCDLRKPSLHKYLKISNQKGFSNLVKEYTSVMGDLINSDYIRQVECPLTKEMMYVITSGTKVYNPAEVLASERFKTILEKLREEFDMIIIDNPPALAVADAVYVSHETDGTVFVVSSNSTNKNHAKQAITQLKRNGVNILGVILTKVEKDAGGYGYYYYY